MRWLALAAVGLIVSLIVILIHSGKKNEPDEKPPQDSIGQM
jgi:hypothetical protein